MTLAFPDGTDGRLPGRRHRLLRRLGHRAAGPRGDGGRSTSPRASTASPTRSSSASDGAAPRNTGGGAPISAPLIGTDLDAGAEVPETLRTLTSALRDRLDGVDADRRRRAGDAARGRRRRGAVSGVPGLDDIEQRRRHRHGHLRRRGRRLRALPRARGGRGARGLHHRDAHRVGHGAGRLRPAGPEDRQDHLRHRARRPGGPLRRDGRHHDHLDAAGVAGAGPRRRTARRGRQRRRARLDVQATIPSGLRAIVGYLPAKITAADAARARSRTVVDIAPTATTYDLFDLYDGKLTATPSFSDPAGTPRRASASASRPWSAAPPAPSTSRAASTSRGRPAPVTTRASARSPTTRSRSTWARSSTRSPPRSRSSTPTWPRSATSSRCCARRSRWSPTSPSSPAATRSRCSRLLETLSAATEKPQLELAHRVIGLVDGVTDVMHGIATAQEGRRAGGHPAGEPRATPARLLTLDPSEVELYE